MPFVAYVQELEWTVVGLYNKTANYCDKERSEQKVNNVCEASNLKIVKLSCFLKSKEKEK